MFDFHINKTIKDSVHGYVDIPKCFIDNIIDTKEFQRLRNVDQTGMRVLYPSARHDRFSHSIGVFHLGQKAVNALLENFSKDKYWKIDTDDQSILFWAKNKVLFLIACLLHDIGHAPYSHSLEDLVMENSGGSEQFTSMLSERIRSGEAKYIKQFKMEENYDFEIKAAAHEKLGARIILDHVFDDNIKKIFEELHNMSFPFPESRGLLFSEYYSDEIVMEKYDDGNTAIFEDDLCFIARMILGLKYNSWYPERQIRNCFIELLNGNNFDVDKLDYILRDTHMSGISNVDVDVERLLGALDIITGTRHTNKTELILKVNDVKDSIKKQDMVISQFNNNKDHQINIKGDISGEFIIKQGTTVSLRDSSFIKLLSDLRGDLADITLGDENVFVEFEESSSIDTDDGTVEAENNKKTVHGQTKTRNNPNKNMPLRVKNGKLISQFVFTANEEIILSIFGPCDLHIDGACESKGPLILFSVEQIGGNINSIEILADTFQENYTKTKKPGAIGYNTFYIGFNKQAINCIANVLDARNYLYLWIYSHHKVVYYANYLIPEIARSMSAKINKKRFPSWQLSYDDLTKIDDYYFWTAVKYLYDDAFSCDEKNLVDQLLGRKYIKSVIKSLAEFEILMKRFNSVDEQKIFDYLSDKLSCKNHGFGMLDQKEVDSINSYLHTVLARSDHKFEIDRLVFVPVDFKRKELCGEKVYINMNGQSKQKRPFPMSMLSLLDTATDDGAAYSSDKSNRKSTNYFYLYYTVKNVKCDEEMHDNDAFSERESIKTAIKMYFHTDILKDK